MRDSFAIQLVEHCMTAFQPVTGAARSWSYDKTELLRCVAVLLYNSVDMNCMAVRLRYVINVKELCPLNVVIRE